MSRQTIIVLNGTSSSGKTSIAHALQAKFKQPYLHFKMDAFWYMVPKNHKANSENFPYMKFAIIDSAKALLDRGHNLIMDIVCNAKNIAQLKEEFKDHDLHIIAIRADLSTINAREKKRGNREIGLGASQYEWMHEDINYDFDVNTSLFTTDACADLIINQYLKAG